MKKQIIISIISFLAIVGVASAGNYIVQRGDTLSQLALDNNTSVESIVVANNIQNPDLIYVGQSLNIPNLLGGNTPFRPSEFTTTLATSLTEGHSGTTLKVNSITTKDGQTLSSEILGDVIVLHINSGKSNSEIVKCTGLTTATRTFTGCTFGYRFDTNTTATANVKAHSQGETVIISNDDLYLTTQYPTIDGTNIFLGNNYIASSTQDVVRFYMTTSTDIYLWANKATGQFGFATSSATERIFSESGTTFSVVNPMTLTSGELRLATSTAWFNLVDSKLSVATSTTSNFSLAWNDKWLATSTIPNLTMGNATTTGSFVVGSKNVGESLTFGGDGSDGALNITTGTTTIDANFESIVVKNYSSITIADASGLTISNASASGTTLILRSAGNCTINGYIDMSGKGAATSTINNSLDGYDHYGGQGVLTTPGTGGKAYASTTEFFYSTSNANKLYSRYIFVAPGAGGGKGGLGSRAYTTPGDGGKGGGAIIIECAGILRFAGGINVNGENGFSQAGSPTNTDSGSGGGGGGSSGMALVLYNSISTNTGVIYAKGGSGGAGGAADDDSTAYTGGAGGAGAGCFRKIGQVGGAGGSDGAGNNGLSSTGCEGAGGGAGGADASGAGGTGGTQSATSDSNMYLITKNIWF